MDDDLQPELNDESADETTESAAEQRPNNEVVAEETMEARRQGVELASDVLDSTHSRIVERRTVENVMEDSYLRYYRSRPS
jgi:hypothetical protein